MAGRGVRRVGEAVGPSASVGYDFGSAVSDRYRAPYAFTGRPRRLDVDVDPSGHHRAEHAQARLAAEMRPSVSAAAAPEPRSADDCLS